MKIDSALIEDCIKGKRKAQYALYQLLFNPLMRVCMRYFRNEEDAAELLNQGFLKICTKLETYNSDYPFEVWAKRIMVNTIIDNFRANKKENDLLRVTDFTDQTAFNEPMHNELDDAIGADQILDYLNELPFNLRQVFNLFEIEGYSHKEIGDILNISERSSKRFLAKSKALLQEKIRSYKKRELLELAI